MILGIKNWNLFIHSFEKNRFESFYFNGKKKFLDTVFNSTLYLMHANVSSKTGF